MFKSIKVDSLRALNDHVLVADMNFKERKLSSGIYLLNDDGRGAGIRPRWAQVYAVGPDQQDVKPGQWVLIEHGRWSRGLEVDIDDSEFTIRRVDPNWVIFVSDEEPNGVDTISSAVHAERKER